MHSPRSVALALLLLGSVTTTQRASALTSDLGLGVGAGWQWLDMSSGAERHLDGLAADLDFRLFHPSGHGGGVRVAGLTEIKLFGGREDGAFVLDVPYAFRFNDQESGWHFVPTLLAGPSLVRTSATYREECFLGCSNTPPPDLHARDHVALGGVLGGSLDLHRGRAFVGIDMSARRVLAVDNASVDGDTQLMTLLRFGATLGPATKP
jgi:hypothetical protein